MRKAITALVVFMAACLAAATAAAADPGPIQVSGQSADTQQQAAAASSATQVNPSNTNISVRVLSPGSDGDVTQSNTAASSASAGNAASTTQNADQGAGGSGIQTSQQSAGTDQLALAFSAAKQIDPSNTNVPVRVLSPGSNGDVTQSNSAASRADSGNKADTTQDGSQTQSGSSCGCDGQSTGSGIQTSDQSAETGQSAAALSEAKQIDPSNTAVSVRVLSPGDGGSVSQSNNAESSAKSGNEATTSQSGSQTQSAGKCGCDGDPIQVAKQSADTEQDSAALSTALQHGASNDASPVRVWSPGSDGDVTQSNNAASSAQSGNAASTKQDGYQTQGGSDCGCDGKGKAIQVLGQEAKTEQSSAALSGAFQLFGDHSRCGCDGSTSGNDASPVRVWSPGSDGDVTQSNTAASSAASGNRASTTQDGSQSEAGGGLQIQALGQKAETGQKALAASLAAQIGASNNASPVRVWSPGGGGSVDQSNEAASSASAGNDARTYQSGRQLIAGGRCSCERLPIQAAGQWAGTAQLAPAFSAAFQLSGHNESSPTSVKSHGSDGALEQTNSTGSRGDAGNLAWSGQGVSQTS
jgi:GTP cyclohydrolase II